MPERSGGRGRPKIDWERVAQALGANDENALITCRLCKANGVVAYVAEHILSAHPASPQARKVRQIVFGEPERAGPPPPRSRRPRTRKER